MSGRIIAIDISNFKSFVGRYKLKPLMPWMGILAPNGSGKSSLVDAMMFALGESDYSLLRINELAEFIPENTTPFQCQTFVSITISSGAHSTEFKRLVVKNGPSGEYNSLYVRDGQIVEPVEYIEKLKVLGINTEAHDFVVYQDSINDIINASPMDRTRMLEIASGSIKFKELYDELAANRLDIEKNVSLLTTEQKELKKNILKCKSAEANENERKERKRSLKEMQEQYFLIQLRMNDLQTEALDTTPWEVSPGNVDDTDDLEVTRNMQRAQEQIETSQQSLKERNEELEQLTIKLKKTQNLEATYENEVKKLKALVEAQKVCQDTLDDIRRNEEELRTHFYGHAEYRDDLIVAENEDEYLKLRSRLEDELPVTPVSQFRDVDPRKLLHDLDHLQKRSQLLTKSLNSNKALTDKNEASLAKHSQELQRITSEIDDLSSQKRERAKLVLSQEQISKLKARKLQLEGQMEALEASKEFKNSVKKQNETLKKLKKEFPGVYDRLTNLIVVPQKRYKIAVAGALDRKLNSIVVDNDATVVACIEYLEQHKIGVESFLSLESVTSGALDRNVVSQLKPLEAHLLYDAVNYDAHFEPIVRAVVKSTILCETLDEAWKARDQMKSLRKQHDVVTMDGVLVTSNCIVTAGFQTRAVRSEGISTVDERELTKINETLSLTLNGRQNDQVQELETKLKLMQRCKKHLEVAIEEIKRDNESQEKEKLAIERELNDVDQSKLSLQKRIDEFQVKSKEFNRQSNELRQSIFREFCKKIGRKDISEFEMMIEIRDKRVQSKKAVEVRLKDLQELKELEEKRSRSKDLPKWVEKIGEFDRNLKKTQNERENLKARLSNVRESIKKLEGVLEAAKATLSAGEEKKKLIQELKCKKRRKTMQINRRKREMRSQRESIISSARAEDISLPEIGGNSECNSVSSMDSQKIFDYSSLRKLASETSIKHLEDKVTVLEESIQKLLKEVSEHDVVVVASGESLPVLDQKLTETTTRIKELRDREREMLAEFKNVQRERSDAFNLFFEKVAEAIDGICKKINNSETAQAVLIPKDPIEPYMDGIVYDCTPAGKKFRTGDQLSGGEKAMAGLTFLFALQESRSSSFIILDEVDGALDTRFVTGLIDYLKSLKMKHQIFMISHNHHVSSEADALICVKPDIRSNRLMSDPLMVDLVRFDSLPN